MRECIVLTTQDTLPYIWGTCKLYHVVTCKLKY